MVHEARHEPGDGLARRGVADLAVRVDEASRAAISLGGRDSQSIAFFATPGMPLLYSGVAGSKPSAASLQRFLVYSGIAGGAASGRRAR